MMLHLALAVYENMFRAITSLLYHLIAALGAVPSPIDISLLLLQMSLFKLLTEGSSACVAK